MVPGILRSGNYTFLLILRKALIHGRQSILVPQAKALPSSTTDAAMDSVGVLGCETKRDYDSRLLLDDIIKRCLETAALQWSEVVEYNGHPHHHGRQYATQTTVKTAEIDRIVEIIEQAASRHDMDIIRKLFVSMLEAPGKNTTKFTQLCTPFIPRLKAVLVKTGLDLYSPPFTDLLQVFIGSYSRDVLGTRVTELPSVIAASTWSNRERDARTFLASIGSDSDISRIMGSSYTDVLAALQGTRPFSVVRTTIEVLPTTNCVQTVASGNTGPAATSHGALSPVQTSMPSSSSSVIPVAPRPLAGMKRKAVVQLGPDIDLTGENY